VSGQSTLSVLLCVENQCWGLIREGSRVQGNRNVQRSNRRPKTNNGSGLPVHDMLKLSLAVLFAIGCAASRANAEPCVKVRSSSDRYSCMKFTAEELKKASAHGLRLGATYAQVKQHLLINGWLLDRKWIRENLMTEPASDGLVCGSGMDAVCTTAFTKNRKTISLELSGINEGIPLVSVETEPSR
jgi:hypothetical protein